MQSTMPQDRQDNDQVTKKFAMPSLAELILLKAQHIPIAT